MICEGGREGEGGGEGGVCETRTLNALPSRATNPPSLPPFPPPYLQCLSISGRTDHPRAQRPRRARHTERVLTLRSLLRKGVNGPSAHHQAAVENDAEDDHVADQGC